MSFMEQYTAWRDRRRTRKAFKALGKLADDNGRAIERLGQAMAKAVLALDALADAKAAQDAEVEWPPSDG